MTLTETASNLLIHTIPLFLTSRNSILFGTEYDWLTVHFRSFLADRCEITVQKSLNGAFLEISFKRTYSARSCALLHFSFLSYSSHLEQGCDGGSYSGHYTTMRQS